MNEKRSLVLIVLALHWPHDVRHIFTSMCSFRFLETMDALQFSAGLFACYHYFKVQVWGQELVWSLPLVSQGQTVSFHNSFGHLLLVY